MNSFRSSEQARIDRKNTDRKRWLIAHEPLCIFCLKPVSGGEAELCHKIRRSYASSYYTREVIQTMPLNTGLGHHDCHVMFDDNPNQARYMPGIGKILADIERIDIDYYNVIYERYTLIQ